MKQTMNHCKNCKWWGKYHPYDRICDAPEEDRETDTQFSIVVTASDDQGLSYQLKTGPLSGCSRFESHH